MVALAWILIAALVLTVIGLCAPAASEAKRAETLSGAVIVLGALGLALSIVVVLAHG